MFLKSFSQTQGMVASVYYNDLTRTHGKASECIQCGKCEKHCPQHIAIRRELKNAKKKLEGPIYKVARWFVKLLRAY